MDPRLLDYYNQELVSLRELASEFAKAHPRIGRRLVVQPGDVQDPYVERLIESFCFMAARTQVKLDTEFPRFTGRLLEVLYPNYVAPTPSMAVARFYPESSDPDLAQGLTIPRGTMVKSRVAEGEITPCQFRTGQDITLYPLAVAEARLTNVPADIPALDRYVPSHRQIRGALRLRLQTTNATRIAELRDLDRLPVYLAGDEQVASFLFELLHVGAVATLVGEPDRIGADGKPVHAVTRDAVVSEGMGTEQGLLPLTWSTFHGHNLLHEYFACPSRFYFFALTGLAAGLRRIDGHSVEIVVLLDQSTERLAPLVDASRFALFCSPVVNLFRRRTDQIELAERDVEFRLTPSRLEPMDYEVFSVDRLLGQKKFGAPELEFRPLYQTLNSDEGNYGRYFSTRREPRLTSQSARRYGTRTPYIGTELFVSLVDQHEAPFSEDIRYLSVDAWLTNRDLPMLVPRNGVSDLFSDDMDALAGLASIGLIRPPSTPKAPFAERELAWRLIRQLNFNFLPFSEMDHRAGGQGLRDALRLFLASDDAEQHRQVEALIGVKTQPATRVLPGNGPLVFGRGIECTLTVDESGFSGVSPYLLGTILEHYLARHVSINAFTQTELHSMQRGKVARWPVRMGARA
ncbi:type VI secretion system baseplate subunit TssF [Paraburkholderia acidisoli]|uniref:Type VI secretion system baseplate subunit TssF n=1 Tax=Paraburkholderia acidisoli TaxID=2571748 RepID=A0A7Z2GM76_9BURK|nr:type VI secretion system baseplate subunit TssF [Paraburkholderia acidisoli]QGZ64090.1 type VI secretion system baseplate subunit TssF [Paraburkholderia acidisoli]